MKKLWVVFLILTVTTAFAAQKQKLYKVSGFVGQSSAEAAPGIEVILIDPETEDEIGADTTNFLGKYTIKDVPPGSYVLQVEKIKRSVRVKDKNVRLDIDLSAPAGTMDYTKTGAIMIRKEQEAKAKSGEGSGGGAPGEPPGPSDPKMMQAMAAEYYHYSGSTERKVMFCPNGTFFDSYESGYSGSGRDSLGNQTLAWGQASQGQGSGRWSIQGNDQSGTITLVYNNGKRVVWNYKAGRESGDYSMNGTIYARSGPARCR